VDGRFAYGAFWYHLIHDLLPECMHGVTPYILLLFLLNLHPRDGFLENVFSCTEFENGADIFGADVSVDKSTDGFGDWSALVPRHMGCDDARDGTQVDDLVVFGCHGTSNLFWREFIFFRNEAYSDYRLL